MRVCVIGLGYIGLPTAALIASKGMAVHGVDINSSTVDLVNKGKVHIEEVGLEALVADVVSKKLLYASKDVKKADVFIVSVPTPFKKDYEPDLSYVESAIRSICPYLESGNLVIIESTCPVGTTLNSLMLIENMRPDLFSHIADDTNGKVFVAHCPERVLPGKILYELEHNDRVIGGINTQSTNLAISFYSSFIKGECMGTDANTAEMVKLAENAFRDVNIAYANELSMISDKLNVNVWELIRLANHHPRVNILNPGPGVGGHCIAVDPWFVIKAVPDIAKLMRSAREVNVEKERWVLEKVLNMASAHKKPVITIYGLAFKSNIDDFRESPALSIAFNVAIKLKNADIRIIEPFLSSLPENLSTLENVSFHEMCEIDLIANGIHLLLVDHDQFSKINFDKMDQVIDTRGQFISKASSK